MSAIDPAVISYRVEANSRNIEKLTSWRSDVDKSITSTNEQLRQVRDDIRDVKANIASIKRLMITLLVSITSGTVLLSISLLAATGRLG